MISSVIPLPVKCICNLHAIRLWWTCLACWGPSPKVRGANNGPNGGIAGGCGGPLWDRNRSTLQCVRSDSGGPRGFDRVSRGAADFKQGSRMGSTRYDHRPINAAECRLFSWAISARGGCHLVHEED